MVSKGRADDRLRRRAPTRERKKRILVVAEGKVTEPKYLKAFLLEGRKSRLVEVRVVGEGGVPSTVVQKAIEGRDETEREAKRERDDNLRFDSVWAVFDRDDHPSFANALTQARAAEIEAAPSNPSFELWALLHFEDQFGFIHRDKVRERIKKYMPDYDKELDYEQLSARYSDALRRARALDVAAQRNGDPVGNPTTAIHRLTELILKSA